MNLFNSAIELEKKADNFGFSWEQPQQILEQIKSECDEITEHLPSTTDNIQALQMEIGDLLHAVISLCVFVKLDPETTLNNSLQKFESRLNEVISLAKANGFTTLKGQSFETLMAFWDRAKQSVG